MRATRMARAGARAGMLAVAVNGPRRSPTALAGKAVLDLASDPLSPLELRQYRLTEPLLIFIGHGRQHGLDL
jgi:hypothetical protein